MEKKNVKGYVGKCYRTFCVIFFSKKNLKRDTTFLGLAALALVAFWFFSFDVPRFAAQEKNVAAEENQAVLGEETATQTEEEAVAQDEKDVAAVLAKINADSWVPYQNTWYGFSLKYPNDWADPVVRKAVAGSMWEQQMQFRTKQTDEQNPFEGFDVVVYNVAKVKQVANTEEYPKLKSMELNADGGCATVNGHLLESDDFPAAEIYIPSNDSCFNAALFFNDTRDEYIYNLVPKLKDGMGFAGDPAREIKSHMPEFFAMASTFELIDIQRPKTIIVKPKVAAPLPLAYNTSAGKRVCPNKHDHPSYSKKHKGRHVDEDCCMDPDEYPNPGCYYK